jgi:ABC-type transporter Mla subunit MlaD
MANDPTLSVVLVLVAVAVLMQAGAMVGIWFAIKKINGEVAGIRADVKQRLDPLTQNVNELLSGSREPVRNITANLAEISRIMRDRAAHVDSMVADLVDKSRLQVARVDQMMGDLVEKVETTADTVQRNVLAPLNEVSAVVKGVRSGLEFLFSRRRSTSITDAPQPQDEQLFI